MDMNSELMKVNKRDVERQIEYVHSAVVYQKYLSRMVRQLSILPTSLDIFEI